MDSFSRSSTACRPITWALYIVPFAIGNFLGPLVLGPLFDRWGRRVMIPLTYALSGVLLLATGGLFVAGALNALTQTLAWMLVFFVASAAASSAYLTVSELFPVELRGMAIAVFYAFGTLVGAGAPALFGAIVDTGDPTPAVRGLRARRRLDDGRGRRGARVRCRCRAPASRGPYTRRIATELGWL